MKTKKEDKPDIKWLDQSYRCGRRNFIKNAAFAGSMFLLFGNVKCVSPNNDHDDDYSMIVVDYSKCIGCRTCETVCSAFNNKKIVNNKVLNGLGNPYYSRIWNFKFNPDVDITAVCVMCPENYCIEACGAKPDHITGRKALYRDEKTLAIKHNPEVCMGCTNCAEACSAHSVGIIIPNSETNMPEHICNLCEGDPQCVKYCPRGALSHEKVDTAMEFYNMPPDEIAEEFFKRWYNV